MDKFVVLKIKGRQYKVKEGDEFLVDLVDSKDLNPEVLLFVDNQKVEVGTPVLGKIKVKLKTIKEEEKGKKIKVFKYKSKSRYRKRSGFRPRYTRLLLERVSN